LTPPMCITEDDVTDIIRILADSITAVEKRMGYRS
jgi:adenosylmethionine-8-amino-7-oxononanoate aminotransferase